MLRAARPGLTESEIVESSFAQISTSEIIVTLLSATGGASLINLRKYEHRARVHFIPNLKVGVFVTLRAPNVIKPKYPHLLSLNISEVATHVSCSYVT